MYERGDKVWYWTEGARHKASKAVFLKYDDHFPEEDCILVIPIGKTFKQRFRWPLRLVESAH